MPGRYQTVNVPNVGPLNFPADMPLPQVGAIIRQKFPEVLSPQKKQSQEAFGKVYGIPSPKEGTLPSIFTPTPTATSKTSNAFRARANEGQEEFNNEQGNAPLPIQKPVVPQFGFSNPGGFQSTPAPMAMPLQPIATGAEIASPLSKEAGVGTGRDAEAARKAVFQARLSPNGVVAETGRALKKEAETPLIESFFQNNFGINPGDYLRMALAERQTTPGTLEAPDSKTLQALKGLGRGVYGAVAGFTTPENILLAGGLAAAPESALARLAGAGFVGQMGYQGGKEGIESLKDLEAGNVGTGVEKGVGAALNLGMAGLGGLHMLHEARAGKPLATETAPQETVPQENVNVRPAPEAGSFGAKLLQALSRRPNISTPEAAAPQQPSPIDAIASQIEHAAANPATPQVLEDRVADFEVRHNMDRETLANDIQDKLRGGHRVTPGEVQFMSDYDRLKGKPTVIPRPPKSVIATPEQMVQKEPEVVPTPAPVPPPVERRTNTTRRQELEAMTPEQLRQELLTNHVSGLSNKRAFDLVQDERPAPVVGFGDVDGLKYLNDTYGHAAGDALLKAKAAALQQAGVDAYHISGDEFAYRDQDSVALKTKLDKANEILKNTSLEFPDKKGQPIKVKGAGFSYGISDDLSSAEAAMDAHKKARLASGERGARGEQGPITEIKPAAVKPVPAKPVEVTPKAEATPQAVKPLSEAPKPEVTEQAPISAVGHESRIRKLLGSLIRIKELQKASKDRLAVERTLRAAEPVIQLKGEKETPELAAANKLLQNNISVEPEDLGSVARALNVDPDTIRKQNYRLNEAQVARLKQMLSEGKSAIPLNPEHPEYKFASKGIHPLAAVNSENLEAAGLPNPRDRWALLTPKEKAVLKAFKKRQGTSEVADSGSATTAREQGDARSVKQQTSKAAQLEAAGYNVVGTHQAEDAGIVTKRGKGLQTLLFEHELAQKVLERRLKQILDNLKDAVPEWSKARAGAKEPSALSQEVAAFSARLKQSIPQELYAQEHLRPKTGEGAQSPFVQKPLQATETPSVKPTGESPVTTTESANPNSPVVKKLTDLADKIEQHGEDAFGGVQKIFDAVSAKFKTPNGINSALLKTMTRYHQYLQSGVEAPLEKALADVLEKLPPEKGDQTTLYSNPVGALWEAFKKQRDAFVPATPFPAPIELPKTALANFTEDIASEKKAPLADKLKATFGKDAQRVADFLHYILSPDPADLFQRPALARDLQTKLANLLEVARAAWAERRGLTPVRKAWGIRSLRITQAAIDFHNFVAKVNDLHPSATRQEAMVNYLQASGGIHPERDVLAELEGKANSFVNNSNESSRLQRGYKTAQQLTDDEKLFVARYREYEKEMTAKEEAAGVTLQRRENYIEQLWGKSSRFYHDMRAIFQGGGFSTVGTFAKLRKYEDYFEGEMDGGVPLNKTFSYLITARAKSSATVLANREFIENLRTSISGDGKPVVDTQGIGTFSVENPSADEMKGAVLIKQARPSDAVTADGRPYVPYNHPAFQNWKWVATVDGGLDAEGKPRQKTSVLYKGSMLVHPDHFKEIDRLLKPSAYNKSTVATTVLHVSSAAKQTLLIGLFHPVQLAVHSLEHAAIGSGVFIDEPQTTSLRAIKALNPASKNIIDLTQQDQQQGVIHGLQLASFNPESVFGEGLMSQGLGKGMPVVGTMLRKLHDAMFNSYIPNLKMATYLDILKRNRFRYLKEYTAQENAKLVNPTQVDFGKASIRAQSRIYRLSAEQANSGFGGLDWAAIPLNATWRDSLRLMLLAPDFLLARMQFVGDAFRPGGAESRRALLAGAFIQYTAARAFNAAMNDGDPKWDIHDWNKFIVGRHEYSLRTVQGDLMDSVLSPRRFIQHRINPITLRPILEAATQKDVFGHPVDGEQQLFDMVKNIVPMPMQGIADALGSHYDHSLRQGKHDEQIMDTVIQSFGLQRRQYRTPAERLIYEAFDKIHAQPSQDEWALEQKNTFRYLREQFLEGKLKNADLHEALKNRTLKYSELQYLFKTQHETRLVREARLLQPNEVLQAWSKGTQMERLELAPILFSKAKLLPIADQQKVYNEVSKFYHSQSPDQRKKLFKEMNDEVEYEFPPPIKPDAKKLNTPQIQENP